MIYDAIVVGAGAAGCFAAKELTEGELGVLLLEAGPEIDPARDFPMPPPRDRGLLDRALLGLTGQPVQARCYPCTRATRHFYVVDRDNPYRTPKEKPFNWFRGRQVGGRLHTWGRVALRFSDWELRPSLHGVPGTDWPISYADLAPFYDRVEGFLGVHGASEGLPQMPDGRFIEPRSLTASEKHIRDAISARWPNRRFVPARVVKHNPSRNPLALDAATKTGRLSLRANSVVTRIRVNPHGTKASGVSFIDRDTKEHFDVEARVVVLCASAIESVRILLNSGQEGNPNGLGGSSGLLGRFLMDHCMVTVAGTVPADWVRRSGPEPIGSNDDPYDLAANYIYLPGFKNITEPSPEFVGSYGILGQVGRANAYHFIGLGEMLPRFENRVTLSTKVRDAWGIPAAYIECAHSENEHALLADMTRTMQDLAVAGGLPVQELIRRRGGGIRDALYRRLRHKVWTSYGAFHPGAAIHELGGARMGDDPRNSVLDRFNRCWDVPNVFVTDGACFVSSGHQSTTLTIMALTVRACESIVSQFRKGDL